MLSHDSAHHIVTAVVVTHDGARWLPETLRALRSQSRPVQRVIGVDTGSIDQSPQILAEYLAPDAILTLPRDTGYGDAIREAMKHPRTNTEVSAGEDATEWIWLIHDDCAPDRDALHHLLVAADDDPRAVILGPKLRDWFDRRLLLEAGVTIDGAGRRETGLERREFDQGQHDGTRTVLAVSSAGMLVRRDIWAKLRGFDPELPLFRDDIDLCWRAGMAGHRTLVVTDAIAYHAEAAARRRRNISATSDHPRRIDRRNATFVLLANLPFGAMVGSLLRNTLSSFLRVLLYLLAKQPGTALDEIVAITAVYLTPLRLIRARFRRRRGRRRSHSAIQPFFARGVALRRFTELITGLLSGAAEPSGRHQAAGSGSEEEDDPFARNDEGLMRRILRHPGSVLVTGLVVITLIAERELLLGGRLAGGALLPVWGSASDLWAIYLSGWHEVGVGSGAAAPPHVGVLALLSTITLGSPQLAVSALLLGCVPLAGLAAYLLARRVLDYRPAQLWMAASYALLPVATGAVAQGRLGSAIVHALLPVLGILLTRVLTLPPRPSRRSAWALALVLALSTAFVPLVWPLAALTAVCTAIVFGERRKRLYSSLIIALVAPLLLLMPWTLRLLRHPSLWLLETGLHRPELSDPDLSAYALLLLSPGGPGLPPVWVTAGFVLAALCALLLRERRMLVAAGWGVALAGILIAILVSRTTLAAPEGGPAAAAWPGVALAFAATAMLLSAATAAQTIAAMFRMGGLRRIAATAVTALAVTTPLAAAGAWMWQGVDGPVTAQEQRVLPHLVATLSQDSAQPRTLVIRGGAEEMVEYSVLRGREPRLGEAQLPPDPQVSAELGQVVAALAAGRGGDEAEVLAEFGIQYVLLSTGGAQSDEDAGETPDATLVNRLDGTPGMRRLNLTPEYALWRLDEETGELRIVDPRGGRPTVVLPGDEPEVVVPPGSTTRVLVLAEPVDERWSAELSGTELRPTQTATGLQAFELPADSGRLQIDRDDRARQAWLLAQAALLLVVIVLAMPAVNAGAESGGEAVRSGDEPRRRGTPPGSRRAPRSGGRRDQGRRTRSTVGGQRS